MRRERLVQALLALDRRDVGEDAAERHDAPLGAHRREQRLGHGAAVRHAVEGDVRDVVRVVVPRVQVVRLVPLWSRRRRQPPGRHRRSGRASGLSLGSTLRTMLPPVLASMALMSATPFSLLPSVTSVTYSTPIALAKAAPPLFQVGVVGVGERADRVDHRRRIGGEDVRGLPTARRARPEGAGCRCRARGADSTDHRAGRLSRASSFASRLPLLRGDPRYQRWQKPRERSIVAGRSPDAAIVARPGGGVGGGRGVSPPPGRGIGDAELLEVGGGVEEVVGAGAQRPAGGGDRRDDRVVVEAAGVALVRGG